jgi:hypothetical protein
MGVQALILFKARIITSRKRSTTLPAGSGSPELRLGLLPRSCWYAVRRSSVGSWSLVKEQIRKKTLSIQRPHSGPKRSSPFSTSNGDMASLGA